MLDETMEEEHVREHLSFFAIVVFHVCCAKSMLTFMPAMPSVHYISLFRFITLMR